VPRYSEAASVPGSGESMARTEMPDFVSVAIVPAADAGSIAEIE
jgi:hypothetical protein